MSNPIRRPARLAASSRCLAVALYTIISTTVVADPTVSGTTISWPDDGWYQVQDPSTGNYDVCNSSANGRSCRVSPGSYVVVNHTTGVRFPSILVPARGGSSDRRVQQTAEMVVFGDGSAAPGAGLLVRSADRLTLQIAAAGLAPDTAYSVWWVLFNEPEQCLEPNLCGEPDVFSAPGLLNATQVPSARISVFNATGFLTDSSGTANVFAELHAGALPEGVFTNFGWSEPVAPGPDPMSGLSPDNGLGVEAHVVLRTHGPIAAGQTGTQIADFDGLCDTADCEDVRALIFRSPGDGS